MSTESSDNKRLAKNTLYLYLRMILVMGITLFSSRIILKALGEEDYGIYNIVGGIVTMFSFFTSTMAATCQRYFSYYIGRDDSKGLAKSFSLNMTIFFLFSICILIIAETFGLWFVNNSLKIPPERIDAMNWVYQFSVFSLIFAIILIPYNALIISFERMNVYARISILEVFLKLLVAISLIFSSGDNLIIYALLMLVSQVFTTLFYCVYCKRSFKESRFYFCFEKQQFKEVLSYSGWHILGAVSVMIQNQGVNILLNIFFNPVVNAGRAIAFQISTAIDSLNSNFFMAVKPQIYKTFAANQFEEFHLLILRSSKMCFFLNMLVSLPILFVVDDILSIWLYEVPTYAILFTELALLNKMIDSLNGPAIAAALATGNIRRFEIITGGLLIMNLPFSYFILKIWQVPELTAVVSIFISLTIVVFRAFLLKNLVKLDMKIYLAKTCLPLLLVLFLSSIPTYLVSQINYSSYIKVVLTVCTSFLFSIIFFYIIALSQKERSIVLNFLKAKINSYYAHREIK